MQNPCKRVLLKFLATTSVLDVLPEHEDCQPLPNCPSEEFHIVKQSEPYETWLLVFPSTNSSPVSKKEGTIVLMEEILHQLICSLSRYLQRVLYIPGG